MKLQTANCCSPFDHLVSAVFKFPTVPAAHLLALGSVEHHQAVTLAALGRGTQLPELVCLGRLGHLCVAEGPRGAGHFRPHVHVQTWSNAIRRGHGTQEGWEGGEELARLHSGLLGPVTLSSLTTACLTRSIFHLHLHLGHLADVFI